MNEAIGERKAVGERERLYLYERGVVAGQARYGLVMSEG